MKEKYKGYEVVVRSPQYNNVVIYLGRKPSTKYEWLVWSKNLSNQTFGPDFKYITWQEADNQFIQLQQVELKKRKPNK